MKSRRKKLLPAVLALTASGCNCGPKTCDSKQDVCKPDGGFYCANPDCFPSIGADGGVEYDSTGQPLCLC